jgi:hypothetical protein
MSDHHYEYASLHVVTIRTLEGPPIDTLTLTRPGAEPAVVVNPLGHMGVLNQMGREGWELVDVQGETFYLMRKLKSAKHKQ